MIKDIFFQQKNVAEKLKHSGFEERIEHLKALKRSLSRHTEELCRAVELDFGKPEVETLLTEIYPTQKEISYAIRNIRQWMRPTRVSSPIIIGFGSSQIHHESKGRALIVSPWNYPIYLSLAPLVAAIAAGCTVILKPSELTENTSKILKKMIEATFDKCHIAVCEGGTEVAKELMTLPFNHMFFTGSTAVGKLYMEAAAKNLCSVTLELGGKSPAFIDKSVNTKWTAKKIIWGKFINAGQTCVAPDYLLVEESTWPKLKEALINEMVSFYPPGKGWVDLAQIVNISHFERLRSYVEQIRSSRVEIVCGGGCDRQTRKIEPLIFSLTEPLGKNNGDFASENNAAVLNPMALEVMNQEIFGPILPVILYRDPKQAVEYVSKGERPLALYIFSKSQDFIQNILNGTSSGGVCINETMMHLGNPELPFGGINHSGIGSYHGIHGFRAFTHERAVYKQSNLGRILSFFYAPYTRNKAKLLKFIIRYTT